MRRRKLIILLMLLCSASCDAAASAGSFPRFAMPQTQIDLHRLAQPATPFNKTGRKFALLGFESGSFEAWAFPLKLVSNVELSFLLGGSTRPIPARDIVRYIDVSPAVTTLTYSFQSFVIKARYITAIDEPAAMVLLEVDSSEPLTIICSFSPVLQPMWPAGIGGQYAYWNDELKAYLISEPTRQNHALIGSPAASGISYTPAHMLSDAPNEFKIEIPNPDEMAAQFIPIIIAGGKGSRDSVKAVYQRISAAPALMFEKASAHYQRLLERGVQIETPEATLDRAYAWARITLDQLMVENSDLGKGLIAGWGASGKSGRPGFGWFFGGDAFMNSLGLIAIGEFAAVRDALLFTQKWQRSDGKMAHELSQAAGYLNWFGSYPYGYIHGDTTPLYIVTCYEYIRASHDFEFLRASWSSLLKAYTWCLATDANDDGLMDNAKAGLGSVEYGPLTDPATDIYTGALSVRMSYAIDCMTKWQKEPKRRKKAAYNFLKAQRAFDAKFWDPAAGAYSNAFNDKDEHLPDPSPWISTAALFCAGTPDHTLASLQRLSQADMTTDWGVRSISSKSKYYGPLNYNYGAVWPFLTGYVATAQYGYQLNQQAYANLIANCRHTDINNLGAINELFSGERYLWPQEAVSQQGFSSLGVVLPLLRGLLGLDGDAPAREVRFSPRFPADWKQVQVNGFDIGKSRWSMLYRREPGLISAVITGENALDYLVTFAPALGIGATIDSVRINGVKSAFSQVALSQAMQPVVQFRHTSQAAKIEIYYQPGFEWILPSVLLRTGDSDSGLKIIAVTRDKNLILVKVQGLAGRRYILQVPESSRIKKVDGAQFSREEIRIDFPRDEQSGYSTRTFSVELIR